MNRDEVKELLDELKEKYKSGAPHDATCPDYTNHIKELKSLILDIHTAVKDEKFNEWASCPYCDNSGSYGKSYEGFHGQEEVEQIQCEFCWTNPNSVYNRSKNILTKIESLIKGK